MQFIRLMGARYCCSILGSIMGVFLFRAAILANVSSAFIISLLSITSVTTSVLFFIVFKELLHRKHMLAIILMIGSVCLVANSQPEQDPMGPPQLTIVAPMAVALILSCIYSVNSLITRYAKYRKIPTLQYSADSSILTGLFILTLFCFENARQPYNLREAAPVIIASIFTLGASLCLNAAMAHGKAGPGQALLQLQSPW